MEAPKAAPLQDASNYVRREAGWGMEGKWLKGAGAVFFPQFFLALARSLGGQLEGWEGREIGEEEVQVRPYEVPVHCLVLFH